MNDEKLKMTSSPTLKGGVSMEVDQREHPRPEGRGIPSLSITKKEFRILLLYPPLCPGKKPKYSLPQIGLLSIGTVLKKKGYSVLLIDGEAEGMGLKELTKTVLKKKPAILGIYVMTDLFPIANKITDVIKKKNPKIKICWGGPHVTATKKESMELNKNIDFIIYGEGENSFLELVKAIKNREKTYAINNLIYRKKGKIIENPNALLIKDLDSLPIPDIRIIHNLKKLTYGAPYVHSNKVASIMVTRGCPYQCTFCDAQLTHGRTLRTRSVNNVLKEMAYYWKGFDINHFVIKDSTFTIRKDWVNDFCKKIKNNKLPYKWYCNTRVDQLTEKLVKTMKQSGCEFISFGLESGSQKMLDRLKKGIKLEQGLKAIKMCKKEGIRTHATFMIGNPGETSYMAYKTIKFSQKVNPDLAGFFNTTAYPGTELYNEAVKDGTLKDPKWYLKLKVKEDSETFLFSPFRGGHLSLDFDTYKWQKKAWRGFYFRPKFMISIFGKMLKDPFYLTHIMKSVPTLLKWVVSKK